MRRETLMVIIAGVVVGVAAVLLVQAGNPKNMGLCIACFERDIAGALGLHGFSKTAWIRPEIIGIILGAFAAALVAKEFHPRGGSSPVSRFLLGVFVVIGALVFLGCPLRMILRLSGGDLNAVVALAGFAAGIGAGVYLLKGGFNFGRTQKQGRLEGYMFPAIAVLLLLLVIFLPSFKKGGPIVVGEAGHPGATKKSAAKAEPVKKPEPAKKEAKEAEAPAKASEKPKGPAEAGKKPEVGKKVAKEPAVGAGLGILISLIAGLAVGVFAQRSRLCLAGGIRDLILIRSSHLLLGFVAILAVVFVGNLILGQFHPGFVIDKGPPIVPQPVAHMAHAWNFLGMALVGIGSVLLGGCPLRQLVLAGGGNTDSAVAVLGMVTGAAFAHNFQLVKAATGYGKAAVFVGLGLCVLIGLMNREK